MKRVNEFSLSRRCFVRKGLYASATTAILYRRIITYSMKTRFGTMRGHALGPDSWSPAHRKWLCKLAHRTTQG